uniref:Chromo domain-containing protein n=1 Tax=Globodera pallida TaxID=36090 RepID=A0A183C7L4_GLOPA
MASLPDDDMPPILDGPYSPARGAGLAETNYSDDYKDFRLADCLQILESIARDYDCIWPLPKLGTRRDHHMSGCLLIRSLGSANRLYIFEWEECLELKGHLEMDDGSSKRVLHEFYEKYDGREGLNRFLRELED